MHVCLILHYQVCNYIYKSDRLIVILFYFIQKIFIKYNTDVGSKIYCASPSEDTHDVDNLISPHKNINSNFFLASHFVKPPCDIIISFP